MAVSAIIPDVRDSNESVAADEYRIHLPFTSPYPHISAIVCSTKALNLVIEPPIHY